MKTVRAFASLTNLADNRVGQTALFGELSPQASTYSRNRQSFSKSSFPDALLEVFSCRDEQDQETTLSSSAADKPLTVIQLVYDKFVTSAIPTNSQKTSFISLIQSTVSGITGVEIGAILQGTSSTQNMPDYVRFTYKEGMVDHVIKIWFSASAFTEYDLFTSYVIAPVAMASSLNGTFDAVKTAVGIRTPQQVLSEVSAKIGIYPPTALTSYTINWSDPADRNNIVQLTWHILGYGPMATTEENIRIAIRDYLASEGIGVNWSNYFVGLFSSNEYTYVPNWNAVSPVGTTTDTGLHAAPQLVNTLQSTAAIRLPSEYESIANLTSFLKKNLQIVPTQYRSLSCLVVGHPANAGDLFKFSDSYGDYIDVPTTSTDYGRMRLSTQELSVRLNTALGLAREYEQGATLPVGYTKYVSGGRNFIAFMHGDYRHLVLTKNSFDNETGV